MKQEYNYSIVAREHVDLIGFDSCMTVAIQEEVSKDYDDKYYGLRVELSDRINASTFQVTHIPCIESKHLEEMGLALIKLAAKMKAIEDVIKEEQSVNG